MNSSNCDKRRGPRNFIFPIRKLLGFSEVYMEFYGTWGLMMHQVFGFAYSIKRLDCHNGGLSLTPMRLLDNISRFT